MSNAPVFNNDMMKNFYASFPGFYQGMPQGFQGFPGFPGALPQGFAAPGAKSCDKEASDCEKPKKKVCKKKKCSKCCAKVVAQPVPVPIPCPPPAPVQVDPCTIIDPFTGPRRAITTWKINYLVANVPNLAAHVDINLIDPWGMVVYKSQLWIAANGTDSLLNYDLYGNKLLGTIMIRDARHNASYPSGLAVNCGGGFPVTATKLSTSSELIVVTEHGTVHGFGPSLDPQNAYIVLNTQITGQIHVYKGVAVVGDLMYLADFFRRQIEVYDSNYIRLFNFPFVDGDMTDPIPLNFSPNNIVNIGCFLYVLWACRDPHITIHDLDGPGNGYISVFNPDGSFVRRFTSRGVLNSPWGMCPAPMECGFPAGSFLVGNQGDGRINVFDCNGRYVGPMLDQRGLPICIEGIWALAGYYTTFSEVFFTSATDENYTGLVGSLVVDNKHFL